MVILLCRVLTLGVLYGISIFALIGGVAMIVITMGMVANDHWMGATWTALCAGLCGGWLVVMVPHTLRLSEQYMGPPPAPNNPNPMMPPEPGDQQRLLPVRG